MRKVFGVLFLLSFLVFAIGLTLIAEPYYSDSSSVIVLFVVYILVGIVSLIMLLLLVTNFNATGKRAYWRLPVLAVLAAMICLILGIVTSIRAPEGIASVKRYESIQSRRSSDDFSMQRGREARVFAQEMRLIGRWPLFGYGLILLVAGVASIAFIRKHNLQLSTTAEQVNAP